MNSHFTRVVQLAFATIILLNLILHPSVTSASPDDTLRITGTDGKSTDWTLAAMKTSFASEIHAVQYTSKDGKHTSNCIPLIALLKSQWVPTEMKMDPSADPKKKNFNMRLAVVAQGADGYTITFSLAELMPEIGNKEAWIALDEDDKPLAERGGPVKLIVPGESMPARNVHGLANIAVVDPTQLLTPKPTTQPSPN